MKYLSLLTLVSSVVLAQGLPIKGGSSSDLAGVDTYKRLLVNTGDSPQDAGFVKMADGAGQMTQVLGNSIRHLVTGVPRVDFSNQIEGVALDARTFNSAATTMTITQANNFITLNAAASAAINLNAQVRSWKTFPYFDSQPLCYVFTFRRPAGQTGQINELVEIGAFNSATNAAVTDGLFFRWNALGEFRAVATNNSTDAQSAVLTAPTALESHIGTICRLATGTQFSIDGATVATLSDAANASAVSVRGLPLAARVVTSASSPLAAPQLQVGPMVAVRFGDLMEPSNNIQNTMENSAVQAPLTPFAQLANHANSTSPVSAALSNTAASYTTLGGRWQFAAAAAAATDFALFGYQVPVGYQMHVSRVAIAGVCNTVAAVATTPTIMDWSVGVNASAVSLATADSFGPPFVTMGPRRVTLGQSSFIVGAAAGACAPDIVQEFNPPLVVEPSRFFHIIMQQHTGTATATEIFRGDVLVNAVFK